MFDGVIENPVALWCLVAAGAVTAALSTIHVRGAWRRGESLSLTGAYGVGLFLLLCLVLIPLNLLQAKLGSPMVAIFGAEGRDTGFVEFLTVAQWAALAALAGVLAQQRRGWERWALALLAVGSFVVMGEEVSWGQWLFHWQSPEFFSENNLQSETNLHNFAGPAFYDWLYRIAGLGVIVAVLVLRAADVRWPLLRDAGDWLRTTLAGLPLALVAATLMQHPAFQELSEAALTAAAVHGLLFLTQKGRPRASTGYVNLTGGVAG